MTGNELKRLRRTDLMEMLLELSKENLTLRQQLDEANERLEDRRLQVEKTGSLAEAAMQLSGIFNTAQEICQNFEYNVRLRCLDLEKQTRKECSEMLEHTRRECEALEAAAQLRCAELEAKANRAAAEHRTAKPGGKTYPAKRKGNNRGKK